MTRSFNTIRLVQFSILTGLFGCGSAIDLSMLNNNKGTTAGSSAAYSLNWQFIDGGSTPGINHTVTYTGKIPKLATLNSGLYATWREDPGASKDTIRVAKYVSNGTWTFVDGNGASGINVNTTKFAGAPSMIGANNRLYVGWHEDNGTGYNQVNVKSYDGTTWTTISPSAGMNYASASAANTQVFAVGNTIYCSWSESSRVHVSKYSGAGSVWTAIDGGTVNGLSYASSVSVGAINMATDGTYLYATWDEANGSYNQIRVAKYDGTSWSYLDGNGANGININTSVSGTGEEIASFNNGLIVAWTESSVVYAKFFDGTTWTNISGTGLNRNAGQAASLYSQGQLAVSGGHLLMSWIESAAGINQTRVAAYDGTSWTFVDGNSAVAGLNYNPATSINAGYGSSIVPFNGGFAATWSEASYSSTYQVRVKFGQ